MSPSLPLPMSHAEMTERGWNEVDVVFVTGDAYADHPSFAAALLARFLEADGFRVGILSQPDWHSADAWKTFGQPKLAFCVSAGNMDSMINHYTANRKLRSSDAYSPGGKIGLRPDRATLSYCQRSREAYPGCTVIAGGVEASLRRLAHYDYWSDKLRRSIVLDSKADLLVYGMGEAPLLEILRRLRDGEHISKIRNVRGTAYRLGRTEDLPEETETTIHLPSQEEVEEDRSQFAKMTRMIYENLNPYLGITLVQEHALEAVVINPPPLPMEQSELDRIYALPFTRKPHPSYGKAKIPALEVVKDSVQIHRGCFGGCTFCSLTSHQGKFIQSRSKASVMAEVSALAAQDGFKGTISDLGGPTANMYALGCKNEETKKICRRLSCLMPTVCPNLNTDHSKVIDLMRAVRKIPNIEKVFVASGVRTDLALLDERYMKELVEYHIGGHLKTAPEHTDPTVLRLMNKPTLENYDQFCSIFSTFNKQAGKEQYLVPYLMAGFPGTTLKMMVETAVYLKQHGIRSEQVQEFIPGPFELATCMYYTGLNPLDGQPIYIPKKLRERRLQKALLMYDDPNNYHDIKSALKETGREDLIGNGADCLITPYPPKALSMRRSSKVKRFQKQNETDKRVKQERREHFETVRQQEEAKQREQRRPPDSERRERRFSDREPREQRDRQRPPADRGQREQRDRQRPPADREQREQRDRQRSPADREQREQRDRQRSPADREQREPREQRDRQRPPADRGQREQRDRQRPPADREQREQRDRQRSPADREQREQRDRQRPPADREQREQRDRQRSPADREQREQRERRPFKPRRDPSSRGNQNNRGGFRKGTR